MEEDIRLAPRAPPTEAMDDPSLAALIKELAQDGSVLVRQEIALAKAEIRDNVQTAARSAVLIGIGAGVAVVGALVLVAFLVLLLGNALGQYWLGALIVGVALLLIGGLLAMKALNDLKDGGLKPEQTVETLKEDKEWLQNEMQDARRELT